MPVADPPKVAAGRKATPDKELSQLRNKFKELYAPAMGPARKS